jgi:hypothetical protein
MFSNNQRPAYVKAKEGKMIARLPNGSTESYDNVEGRISDISLRESQYNGENIKQWNISLGGNLDRAIFTVGYSSSFTKSLINSLLSADLSKPVVLSCYMKNDYNQPSVKQDGQIIRWKYDISEVPRPEKIMVGSKEVSDDSKVAEWIEEKVKELNARIKAKPVVEDTEELHDFGDLPF